MSSDPARTVGDLADQVRSKNAGPFWLTIEAFLPDDESYRIADALITPEAVAELYRVASGELRIFRIPWLRVIKISFPRPVAQGSLRDRDMHSGQQHVPLTGLPIPDAPPARPISDSGTRA